MRVFDFYWPRVLGDRQLENGSLEERFPAGKPSHVLDGDAGYFGAPTGAFNGFNPASAIFSTADGGGYWVASGMGGVYPYGDAPNDGSMAGTRLNGSIIAGTGW